MIKFTYFFDLADGVDEVDGDRWYAESLHAQERTLPGVRRVASWRTRTAPQPADVKRSLNAFHRMTEVWFDDEPTWQRDHVPLLQEAERGGVVGALYGIVVHDQPEYDLLHHVPPQHYPYMSLPLEWKTGRRPRVPEPDGHDMWRYVYFFNYRDGVSLDDGEDWYLGHHTREGKQLPGLVRYVTWRRLGPPQAEKIWANEARRFVRYTELCFEDFETWHQVCYREGLRWHMSDQHPAGVWGDYQQFFLGPAPDLVHQP